MDQADSGSASPTLVTSRLQLHGIAECLLAGPQYQATGEIALAVTPGGFGTTAGSELRLDGLELVAGTRGCQRPGGSAILPTGLGSRLERRESIRTEAVQGGMTLLILIRQLRG